MFAEEGSEENDKNPGVYGLGIELGPLDRKVDYVLSEPRT